MSVLFSIVIPVFNAQDFLPKCINSIIRQKRNNIEIIKSIASKGGTTQAALEKMHSLDFKNILSKSVIMALKKAKALGSK